MITVGRRVCYVRAELPEPVSPLPFVADLPGGWAEWLRDEDLPVGRRF